MLLTYGDIYLSYCSKLHTFRFIPEQWAVFQPQNDLGERRRLFSHTSPHQSFHLHPARGAYFLRWLKNQSRVNNNWVIESLEYYTVDQATFMVEEGGITMLEQANKSQNCFENLGINGLNRGQQMKLLEQKIGQDYQAFHRGSPHR